MSIFTIYKKTFATNGIHFKILEPNYFDGVTLEEMKKEAEEEITSITGVAFFFNQRLIFLVSLENKAFNFSFSDYIQEFAGQEVSILKLEENNLSINGFSTNFFIAEESARKLEKPVAYKLKNNAVILFPAIIWEYYLKSDLIIRE
jgi:hypothetical protein